MTAERRALGASPRSLEHLPLEERRQALEREVEACRQRIARLRAQGASEVSLLHWLERLQACEAALASLQREEAREPRRPRPDGVAA
jgi:hypothetical protein